MSQLRNTLVIASVLATALTLSACSTTITMGGMGDGGATKSAAETGFNDADTNFATGMVPHHEQAVAMADMILVKEGIDPRVTDLAKRIKAAQGPEITEMTAWLTTWGTPVHSMAGMSGMSGMDSGMMSDDDMAALGVAKGNDASKLFLQQMTTHHQGAITMAKTEISDGKNAGAITLAKAILTGQSAEIAEMASILSTLK